MSSKDKLKVLLISPLPGLDPLGGDVTYTELLLANPPEGVEFETHVQAQNANRLKELGVRSSLREKDPILFLRNFLLLIPWAIVNKLRKRGLMFFEPLRLFDVDDEHYDLIHTHAFSCGFLHRTRPYLMNVGANLQSHLYLEGRNWAKARVDLCRMLDNVFARMNGIAYVPDVLSSVTRVLAFSEGFRQWFITSELVREDRIDVVPIYLKQAVTSYVRSPGKKIGFISGSFKAKGGPTLLKAYEVVKQAHPDAQLSIFGCEPELSAAEMERLSITWIKYMPREQLMNSVYPNLDLYVHPTKFDGFPLVLLEAMSNGIPIAASNHGALPEMLGHGKAGLVSPAEDWQALAENMCRLLDPQVNRQYSESTIEFFAKTYTPEVCGPKLKSVYLRTIEEHKKKV